MDTKQPFQIGQKVMASPSLLFRYREWENVELWVCGIRYGNGGFNISVTEQWPPASLGCITDGWDEYDLIARPQSRTQTDNEGEAHMTVHTVSGKASDLAAILKAAKETGYIKGRASRIDCLFALLAIHDMPLREQDNMISANMRKIALAAIEADQHQTEG